MFNITKFFAEGFKNTILLLNNSGFSFNGPWVQVYDNTLIDRWHLGDIGSAEYTIFLDFDNNNKEILKCLVTSTPENANVVIYARNSTNIELVDLRVLVNESYVDLYASPASSVVKGSKLIFSANYFQNQNLA